MKRLYILLLTLFCFGFLLNQTVAQVINTAQAGAWNVATTWQGGTIPTAANSTAINVNHNVSIPSGYTATVDQVTVAAGITLTVAGGGTPGTLNLQSSGGTDLTLTEDLFLLFIGANLVVNGGSINNSLTALGLGTGMSTTAFNADSKYTHAVNGLFLPFSGTTWDATSTCEITGVSTGVPGNLNQTFGHLTWNCSGHTGNLALGLTSTTINGDFTVSNTNSPGILTLASSNGTVDINGNFTVSGASRFLATINSNVTLDVEKNFSFNSSGALSLLISNTGTIDFDLGGNFSVTGGTLQAYAQASATANVTFDGTSIQTFSTSGATLNNDFNWTISSDAIVDMGTSAFINGGTFDLKALATMHVGSADGLETGTTNGNVRVSGTRTYVANSNIIYDGDVAQNLGNEWGSSGDLDGVDVNIEVANTNGVTNNNSGTTTIGGILTLTTGALNIGSAQTLDVQGVFNGSGGSFGGGTSSSLSFSVTGAMNGTLDFSPADMANLTINRSGTVALGTSLDINGILSFASTGNLDISGHTLTIKGSSGDITQSGSGGLSSTLTTTDLILNGTEALSALPFCTTCGTMNLNDVTFGRTGSSPAYTWNSAVTINGDVFLNSGVLTHTSGLNMATGSTFNRGGSGSITAAPTASTTYDVSYSGTLTTGPELPTLVSGDLNNLISAGDVTLDKAIDINGNLTINSGTLSAGTNAVNLSGASFVVNAGAFTINSGTTFTFDNAGTTTMSGAAIDGTQFGNLTIASGATLSAPSANINIAGTWTNNQTFTANSGTITFNGGNQDVNPSGQAFNNVVFGGTLTKTLLGTLDVNGTLAISSTLDGTNRTVTVGGNWTNTGTFTSNSGSVTFDGSGAQSITSGGSVFNDLTIGGSGTKTLQDALDVNGNLTFSSTLNVGSNNTINIAGNWTNSSGTFTAGSGRVTFDGAGTSDINGGGVTVFNDINVTGSATVEIETTHSISGTLALIGASSSFNADGSGGSGDFSLVSSDDSPATDGNIAALTTPANFTGNVTVERYISSGTSWIYIGTPVSGLTIADWQTEFAVSGDFTNTDNGSYGIPSDANASLYYFDAGAEAWQQYPVNQPGDDNTGNIVPGVGYSAWIRDNTGPFTDNVLSQEGPINKGSWDYTQAGKGNLQSSTLGWNLLANPYPAAIDWNALYDDGSTAGVSGIMTIPDNSSGSTVQRGYDAQNNISINSGTKNIAIGQSFYVNSTSSPTLTATELMKTTDSHDFYRLAPPIDYMRIALSQNGVSDETLVFFYNDALPGMDKYDSYKRDNGIFNLTTLNASEESMVVNAVGDMNCITTVQMNFYYYGPDPNNIGQNTDKVVPGAYQLEFSEFESFTSEVEIILHDKFVSKTMKIDESTVYPFEVTSDTMSFGKDRFDVTFDFTGFGMDVTVAGDDAVCSDGAATVIIGNTVNGIKYNLKNSSGELVSEETAGNGSEISFLVDAGVLEDGDNTLQLTGEKSTCGEIVVPSGISITKSNVLEIEEVTSTISCPETSVTIVASGAPEGTTYQWYDASEEKIEGAIEAVYATPSLSVSTDYYVALIGAGGCEGTKTLASAIISSTSLEIDVTSGYNCGPGEVIMTAYGSLENLYRWFDADGLEIKGVTGAEYKVNVTSSTRYSVQSLASSGCESAQMKILAEIRSEAMIPIITRDDNLLLVDGDFDTYQWYEVVDSTFRQIEGERGSSLLVESDSRVYTVEAGTNGCTAFAEPEVITGIDHDVFVVIEIFPNPVSEVIHIDFDHSNAEVLDVYILDMNGKIIYETELKRSESGYNFELNVSNYRSGVYFLKMTDEDKIFSGKFVKE